MRKYQTHLHPTVQSRMWTIIIIIIIMCQWAGTRQQQQQQFCQYRLDWLPEVVWSVSRPAAVAERLPWPTPRQRCTSWWQFGLERWPPTPAGATDRTAGADVEHSLTWRTSPVFILSQSSLYYRCVCKLKFWHLDLSLNATSDLLPL